MSITMKNNVFYSFLHRPISRRHFLGSSALVASGAALNACTPTVAAPLVEPIVAPDIPLGFAEISKRVSQSHALPKGYESQAVISWGDSLFDDTPFDPHNLTAKKQSQQFGYNNDFIAYMPLPKGSDNSEHGLLCVNHEYTNLYLMFDDTIPPDKTLLDVQVEQSQVEMQAQGCSVIEIKREAGNWKVLTGSDYNRRITATSEIEISGEAAGHTLMRTSYDQTGRYARGTMGNCAGGVTPWGTVLTAEENIDHYFGGEVPEDLKGTHGRYRLGTEQYYHWYKADARFDMSKEPHEAHRFGWIVEYNPYDPAQTPVKRTALGRFKHECASTTLTPDGRVVVYSGDDEEFEYIYRFISDGKVDAENPAANWGLLDSGTLSVAQFSDDGTMRWLDLVYGKNGLTERNGFGSQAEVLIFARRAADIAGATPMDRPEDLEVNPVTGSLFVVLTKNALRKSTDSANPRANNVYGHMLELMPPRNEAGLVDHAGESFNWSMFLRGGDPAKQDDDAYYQSDVSSDGWLANPDNITFDKAGNVWITTDGQQKSINFCEGLYAAPAEGDRKGASKLFFTAPMGAEICGPCFTPDNSTLFLSIQHPAEEPRKTSSFNNPSTRWPDFKPDMPARPSVIAISKKGGGVVGS
jgi:uncharacterized protein